MGQTTNEARFHPAHHTHNQKAKFQMAIKAVDDEEERRQERRVERKLFSLFYICALLLITLYVTYAAYYFLQHRQPKSLPEKQPLRPQEFGAGSGLTKVSVGAANEQQMFDEQPAGGEFASRHMQFDLETKLESKILLLQRYIEVIAVDLQDTKEKLREREKCDCSISCTFNGTRYADKSSWQHQCDTCTCQSGLISCAPQKCPQINCDAFVQLAGQCCPTCMNKCKYNDTIIKHGQHFRPKTEAGNSRGPTKECRCYDGIIKCEPFHPQVIISTNHKRVASNGAKQPAVLSNSEQSKSRSAQLIEIGSNSTEAAARQKEWLVPIAPQNEPDERPTTKGSNIVLKTNSASQSHVKASLVAQLVHS